MSLTFPVCQLLLLMAPNHFSFWGCSLIRIVSSTTPGSVSLVHGFTHYKSVLSPQARSKLQTEILVHLLKKLAPVNDVSGVLYLRMRQQNAKATVPLDVVPERRTERCSPRFRPGGRFWSQVSDTCRQAGRESNVGP